MICSPLPDLFTTFHELFAICSLDEIAKIAAGNGDVAGDNPVSADDPTTAHHSSVGDDSTGGGVILRWGKMHQSNSSSRRTMKLRPPPTLHLLQGNQTSMIHRSLLPSVTDDMVGVSSSMRGGVLSYEGKIV